MTFFIPNQAEPAAHFKANIGKFHSDTVALLFVKPPGGHIFPADQGVEHLIALPPQDFLQHGVEPRGNIFPSGLRPQIDRRLGAPAEGFPAERSAGVGVAQKNTVLLPHQPWELLCKSGKAAGEFFQCGRRVFKAHGGVFHIGSVNSQHFRHIFDGRDTNHGKTSFHRAALGFTYILRLKNPPVKVDICPQCG